MASIDPQSIEKIVKYLAELTKGTNITTMFRQLNFYDVDNDESNQTILSTKWKRLNKAVIDECNKSKSYQPFFRVIEYMLKPFDYIDSPESYKEHTDYISSILSFSGYEVNQSGKVVTTKIATNLTEALERRKSLLSKLEPFNIHKTPTSYCTKELLSDNYYHAVFEAAKSVTERLRQMTNSTKDGFQLIDSIFNVKTPAIIFSNSKLTTMQEKNEFNSLKHLSLYVHFTYRNPRAHIPKIFDPTSEEDAILALRLISDIHYSLDRCNTVKILD